MISAQDAASTISTRTRPVVFIDTCNILDLIRGQREPFNGDQASAAVQIIELAETGRLTIALPAQVLTEFHGNIVEVRAGGVRSIDDLTGKLSQHLAVMRAFGTSVPPMPQPSSAQYIAAADTIINRLMTTAIVSTATADVTTKASDRVINGRAPAASTKQSFKDCVVIESVFEIVSLARAVGYEQEAFFLSANLTEYGDDTKRLLHPQLEPEFSALRMNFVKNYLELRYRPEIAALYE